jgi:2-keto-3-deoxy-L-rhamnonate aldolase RhmA
MANQVKQALQSRKAVFGPIVQAFSSPIIVRLLAVAGFDFVYIDMEHGQLSLRDVANLCLVARDCGMVPIVRVVGHQPDHISRPLDAGAQGILVPHIDTAEQARAIIRNAKYPPLGQRSLSSLGPHTGFRSEPVADLVASANADTLIGVMIESAEGVAHVNDIAAVPDIDFVVVGRGDLSQDLGMPGQVDAEIVEEAVSRVLDSCKGYQVPTGLLCQDIPSARKWLARGIQMLNYGSDISLLTAPAAKAVQELRTLAGAQIATDSSRLGQ